jgi:hypothetical protein
MPVGGETQVDPNLGLILWTVLTLVFAVALVVCMIVVVRRGVRRARAPKNDHEAPR